MPISIIKTPSSPIYSAIILMKGINFDEGPPAVKQPNVTVLDYIEPPR